MNKQRVNNWVARAADALTIVGIAKEGKISGRFRTQISSFGAAVTMGSLKAAAAFFADQGSATIPRQLLLSALYYVITQEDLPPKEVFSYICDHDDIYTQEKFIDAAIALKLAMSLYELEEEKSNAESESGLS